MTPYRSGGRVGKMIRSWSSMIFFGGDVIARAITCMNNNNKVVPKILGSVQVKSSQAIDPKSVLDAVNNACEWDLELAPR